MAQPQAQAQAQPPRDFVIGKTDDIKKFYKLGKNIGQPGQFGYAVRAIHNASGQERAVKVISKARFLRSVDKAFHFHQLRAEIEVMQSMDHSNIIKLYEVFENESELYLVMELCTGGELFDRIKEVGNYSEHDACVALRQICEGIQYMHSKNIAHCDLKPDNFLFLTEQKDSVIKIIDFGMAKFVKNRKYFKSLCGTPYYVAPEVIQGQYNHHADMWSLGVVMFVMLFGYPPFYADQNKYGARTDEKIFELVGKGFDPTTRAGYGAHFPAALACSESAKDLISKLLTKNVAKRFTATEALNHPWLKGDTASKEPINPSVLTNLKKFKASNAFTQAVLGLVSDSLTDVELNELKKTFKAIDANGDGSITIEELKAAMQKMGDDKGLQNIDAIMQRADLDHNGVLSYEELLATAVERKITAKEERMWETFRRLDLDGDGRVTAQEIEKVLGKENAKELIAQVDKNGDGTVDYEEFIAAWSQSDDS